MKNLKLGDWVIPESPGNAPEVGDIRTCTLLGKEYAYGRMPDGKYWLCENLKWEGIDSGYWFGYGESDNGWGRFYHKNHLPALKSALSGTPWRLPNDDLYEGDFHNLVSAVGSGNAGNALKAVTDDWFPNSGVEPLDLYGFHGIPTGFMISWRWTSGDDNRVQATFWTDRYSSYDGQKYMLLTYANNNVIIGGALNDQCFSVRLVSDVDPNPPVPIPGLQGTHDIILINSRAVLEASLVQRIDCRLRTFIGEHWLNPELGVPWFEEFLRKAPDLAVCRQILVAVLQDVPGVEEVHSLAVDFAKSSRQMRVSFVVSGSDSIPQQGATVVTL